MACVCARACISFCDMTDADPISPRLGGRSLMRTNREKHIALKTTNARAANNYGLTTSTETARSTTPTSSLTASSSTTTATTSSPKAAAAGVARGWNASRSPTSLRPANERILVSWERTGQREIRFAYLIVRSVSGRAAPLARSAVAAAPVESRGSRSALTNPDFRCEKCHTNRASVSVGKMVLCKDCSLAPTTPAATANAPPATKHVKAACQACEQRSVGARVRLAGK
jgi:hypothetical protein